MTTKLEEAVGRLVIPARERVATLISQHGSTVVSQITVAQIFGGMRDVTALPCDTSEVPAERGLLIRGRPILELTGSQPEAVFWLMLTGELPTPEELLDLQRELSVRGRLIPTHVWRTIETFPRNGHPMRALSMAVLALGESHSTHGHPGGSLFREKVGTVAKGERWRPMLEDCLNLIAYLPAIAAYIYRLRFGHSNDGAHGHRRNPLESGTWSENFAHLLGIRGDGFAEFLRLYLTLQCDHEGGNVSAHTSLLVGSADSDIYYSFAAGLCGLAGPQHGLAAQQCLEWVQKVHTHFGGVPSEMQLDQYIERELADGHTVPGYGHAVLRCDDPRFIAMMQFGDRCCAGDPLFQIVHLTHQVAPRVLKRQGKAKNPRPNTDAAPGSILTHLGMPEAQFYTVLFGVSRALGLCAQAVWAKALSLPIERPHSISLTALEARVAQAAGSPA